MTVPSTVPGHPFSRGDSRGGVVGHRKLQFVFTLHTAGRAGDAGNQQMVCLHYNLISHINDTSCNALEMKCHPYTHTHMHTNCCAMLKNSLELAMNKL